MSDHAFDTLTRRATDVVSRRNTFLTLGGAALAAAIAMPAQTSAKKGKDRCKSQVDKCRTGAADLCESAYAGEFVTQCIERYTPCCEFLKDCKAAEALECVVEKYEDTKK